MLEIFVGWWPAVAATVASFLAVYIRLKSPPEEHNTRWLILFAVLGSTALAATLANQVMLRQEREVSRTERQRERDDATRTHEEDSKQISAVQGKMDALLALVPSLAKGNPEQVVAGMQQVADVQAHLAALEAKAAPRQLSENQRQIFAEVLRPCSATTKVTLEIPVGDPEAATFAEGFREVLKDAGFGDHPPTQAIYSQVARGIVLQIRDPTSPPPCAIALQQVLREQGVTARGNMRKELAPNEIQFIVGSKP